MVYFGMQAFLETLAKTQGFGKKIFFSIFTIRDCSLIKIVPILKFSASGALQTMRKQGIKSSEIINILHLSAVYCYLSYSSKIGLFRVKISG